MSLSSENHQNLRFPPPQQICAVELQPGGSLVADSLKNIVPGTIKCKYFCGGKKCKYCDHERWTGEDAPIKGLFSHWVTERILAMSRPSDLAFSKYSVLDQFQKAGINSIFNLQEVGEHESCGPGNQPSGFSYSPEKLMERKMFFFNFGWRDFGVPTMKSLLDMVRVVASRLDRDEKIAVHCHAGLGRTGLLIACYLVYGLNFSADEAVCHVRRFRGKAIQTRGQLQCVSDFEEYLKPLRIVFHQNEGSTVSFLNNTTTLIASLKDQLLFLHGHEARALRHIPKVVFVVMERLSQLHINAANLASHLKEWHAFLQRVQQNPSSIPSMDPDLQQLIVRLNKENPSWQAIKEVSDPLLLIKLLLAWFQQLSVACFDESSIGSFSHHVEVIKEIVVGSSLSSQENQEARRNESKLLKYVKTICKDVSSGGLVLFLLGFIDQLAKDSSSDQECRSLIHIIAALLSKEVEGSNQSKLSETMLQLWDPALRSALFPETSFSRFFLHPILALKHGHDYESAGLISSKDSTSNLENNVFDVSTSSPSKIVPREVLESESSQHEGDSVSDSNDPTRCHVSTVEVVSVDSAPQNYSSE